MYGNYPHFMKFPAGFGGESHRAQLRGPVWRGRKDEGLVPDRRRAPVFTRTQAAQRVQPVPVRPARGRRGSAAGEM